MKISRTSFPIAIISVLTASLLTASLAAQVSHGPIPGFLPIFLKSKHEVEVAIGPPFSQVPEYDVKNNQGQTGHKAVSIMYDAIMGTKRVQYRFFDGKLTGIVAVFRTAPTQEQIQRVLGIDDRVIIRDFANENHIADNLWNRRLEQLKDKGIFTGPSKQLLFSSKDVKLFGHPDAGTSHSINAVETITDPVQAALFSLQPGDTWVEVQFLF